MTKAGLPISTKTIATANYGSNDSPPRIGGGGIVACLFFHFSLKHCNLLLVLHLLPHFGSVRWGLSSGMRIGSHLRYQRLLLKHPCTAARPSGL